MFWNKKEPDYIKEINEHNKEFDIYMKESDERLKKSDEQINRINIARETGNDDNLIKVYEDIFKEGLCFNGNSHVIRLAELYYKTGQMDKAWGYSNKIGIEFYNANIMDKIRDVQVKILKKENKYLGALISQMAALFYQNSYGIRPTDKKIESKLSGLVKKCDLEDKYEYILYLIFNTPSEIDMRNDFKDMLKTK